MALTSKDLLNLTPEQAEGLYSQGRETVVWALLELQALARRNAADATDLSTPSSQTPPYKKPAAKKRSRKRGRKKGHKGTRRRPPLEITDECRHTLDCCPDCGGPLGEPSDVRERVVEDIAGARPVATRHTVHRYWCPKCCKRVEPRVAQALPKSQIGHRAAALTAWLHYGQGQTVAKIVDVLDAHFHFPVSPGGLTHNWMRLCKIFAPWYEAIGREARASAVLNADETGWRVDGKTHWLWCFTNPTLTWYTINRSRSSKVVNEFLADAFKGTLVTDFYGAYNSAAEGERQYCLAHLLRELKKVGKENSGAEAQRFVKKTKRLLRDALRLRAQRDRKNYARRVNRIHLRLDILAAHTEWTDPDAKRLAKRLDKTRHGLFLFLDDPAVPADNNRAEREIRPAVVARKNSFQNATADGARAQAVFMTIYRTLKLRGHNPIESIADALTIFCATDRIPELPRPPDTPG